MIDGITILNNVTVSDFNPIPWLGVFIGLTVAYIIIYIKKELGYKVKIVNKENKND